jgi:hypothetical protein
MMSDQQREAREQLCQFLDGTDLFEDEKERDEALIKMEAAGLDSVLRMRFVKLQELRNFVAEAVVAPLYQLMTMAVAAQPAPEAYKDGNGLLEWLQKHDLGQYYERFRVSGCVTARTISPLAGSDTDIREFIHAFQTYHIQHLRVLADETRLALSRNRKRGAKQKPPSDAVSKLAEWIEATDLLDPDAVPAVVQGLSDDGVDSLQRLPYVSRALLQKVGVGAAAIDQLLAKIAQERAKHRLVPFEYGDEVGAWLRKHDLEQYIEALKDAGYQTAATIVDIYQHNLIEVGVSKSAHQLHLLDMVRVTKNR